MIEIHPIAYQWTWCARCMVRRDFVANPAGCVRRAGEVVMSEPQEQYIIDALEIMGTRKTIITEVSGFIPVFEVVLHHYKDYMTALVFGRMWQYCLECLTEFVRQAFTRK